MEWIKTNTTNFLIRPIKMISHDEDINEACDLRRKLGFQNAYLSDVNRDPYLKCPIYALFKPDNTMYFNEFLQRSYMHGYLVEEYDYDEYTVLLYKFPTEFEKDYHLVIEGRYSEVSEAFKKVFPEKNLLGQYTVPYLVYHKHEFLRKIRERDLEMSIPKDVELWSVFDMEQETLDINKIKANVGAISKN